MSGHGDQPPARRNPFSPMAVAKITGFEDSDAVDLTIETDAIRQATAYLSAYLGDTPSGGEQGRDGEVIAVLGDYGTGKTHLAIQLVRRAARVLDDPARAVYLDATTDGFVELYVRFMRKLGLAGVRNRVSDYYADIVAESLEGSGLNSDVVEWMRNRELVPREVVERLGLMESALLRKVQRTLQRVTDNTDFGTALTLLLRSGFDDVVWAWLTGAKPDQVLVERGITKPIDTDVAALEAMGVFALLYGGRQARFVLVIDELDKIFSGANTPEADTVTAFQKLLEVFASAGACLVLTGLPEFRRVLHPSAAQRVSRVVEMAGLTTDEVCSFIKLAQRARFGVDELAPFTRDSVRYLREITGGNARNVIRLCHDVYALVDDERRAAGEPELTVTAEIVRRAARRQFGSPSAEDIEAIVRSVLDANGWNYLRKHVLGEHRDTVVDFWVTFPDRESGCAVLVTDSVLDDAEVTAVTRRGFAVRQAVADAKVILVVSGIVTAVYAARLAEELDAEPLVYSERGFPENFRALVGSTSDRLPRTTTDSGTPAALLQQLEQINRQQAAIYGYIERLAGQVDDVRGSSERRFASVQRDLTALAEVARDTGSLGGATSRAELPAQVERFFADAVEVLDELTQPDAMMEQALDRQGADLVLAIQRRLDTSGYVEAFGVAVLTRAAVVAFRASVLAWYRTEITPSTVELSDSAAERLDLLCHAYDDVTEGLPTFKLDPLVHAGPWAASSAAEVSKQERRRRVRTALDNLSPNVRRALSRSLPARGR
jgi:KaiC/GvpD/RAD55 family RecA-like ATPase